MKKITAIFCTLVLAFQLTTVFATDSANIKLSEVSGKKGETVDVTVTLSNCPSWTNIALQYTYDTEALTLVGTNDEYDKNFTPLEELTTEPFVTTWTAGTTPATYNGKILTLQFKIADNATETTYPIGVSFYVGRKGTYVDGKNVNYVADKGGAKTSLGLTYTAGSITVEADKPTLTAETTDGKTVDITATSPEEISGKFVAALYQSETDGEGDQLVECIIKDAAANAQVTFSNKSTGDKIKVMWWDGLDTLTPVCDAYVIEAQD